MRATVHRCAFTLIELLVVIAVMGVLAALLLPAVQQSRESARRTECRSQLRQHALALHNYHDVHRILPAGAYLQGSAFPVRTGWGWGAMILPFLEQSALYERINFNVGTASGTNGSEVIPTPLTIWDCPSDSAPRHLSVTVPGGPSLHIATGNYCGSADALGAMTRTRLGDVTDGLSQTLLVGERVYQAGGGAGTGHYTAGWYGSLSYDLGYLPQSLPFATATSSQPINWAGGSAATFGSRHIGGAQFAMADGSVHYLSENINGQVYQALGTIAGGEVVHF